MSPFYNPIVRTFGRLRTALLESLDVPRQVIRPDTLLELLLPVERRREVWESLRRSGLDIPALHLPERVANASTVAVLAATASAALWLQEWTGLLMGISFGRMAYMLTRPRATCLPRGLQTVGELALYLTSYRDHRDSGYRWTHNEIEFKVRQIVAESMGVALDTVRPETTWAELGAD